MASDAGYGFRIQLKDLLANKKAGKAVLTVPKNARVLEPAPVRGRTDRLAAITNTGHLLVFPITELPELSRGKGNKILGIPAKRAQGREEFLVALASVPDRAMLTVHSGKRYLNLKPSDLDAYQGERGRRGNKLPRGFQNVDRVEVSD